MRFDRFLFFGSSWCMVGLILLAVFNVPILIKIGFWGRLATVLFFTATMITGAFRLYNRMPLTDSSDDSERDPNDRE